MTLYDAQPSALAEIVVDDTDAVREIAPDSWTISRAISGGSLPGQVRGASGISVGQGSVTFGAEDFLTPWPDRLGSPLARVGGRCTLYASGDSPRVPMMPFGRMRVRALSGQALYARTKTATLQDDIRILLNRAPQAETTLITGTTLETFDASLVVRRLLESAGYVFRRGYPVDATQHLVAGLTGTLTPEVGGPLSGGSVGESLLGTAGGHSGFIGTVVDSLSGNVYYPGVSAASEASFQRYVTAGFRVTSQISGGMSRAAFTVYLAALGVHFHLSWDLVSYAIGDSGSASFEVLGPGFATAIEFKVPDARETMLGKEVRVFFEYDKTTHRARVNYGSGWSDWVDWTGPAPVPAPTVDMNVRLTGYQYRPLPSANVYVGTMWAVSDLCILSAASPGILGATPQNYLPPLPALIGYADSDISYLAPPESTTVWDVLQAIARGVLGALWIDEEGRVVFRGRADLRAGSPSIYVRSTERLDDVPWSISEDDVADRVALVFRAPAERVRANMTPSAAEAFVAWELTEMTFIPANSVRTFPITFAGMVARPTEWRPVWSTDATTYPAFYSTWNASPTADTSGAQPPDSALDISLTMLSSNSGRFTVRNTTGTGLYVKQMTARFGTFVTAGEPQEISTGAPESTALSPLQVDLGPYVQSLAQAEEILRWLEDQTSAPQGVLEDVGIIPDEDVPRLGSVIGVYDPITRLNSKALVTGTRANGAAGRLSLSLDLTLLGFTFLDFDAYIYRGFWTGNYNAYTFDLFDDWATSNGIVTFDDFDNFFGSIGGLPL